jgi:hypothetical protein
MPTGTCRLCLTPNVALRDSHFVPRSFYELFHERGLPVTSSPTMTMISGKQATDYLLCGGCEQLFNHGGEQYVRANCWESPTQFPLRAALLASGPSTLSSKELTIFESVGVPDVDRDKLVYFGMSVFWRAAVHRWHMPAGDPVPINLGPYEDPIRRYLLGTADFPQHAVILVSVSHSMEQMKNKSFTPPWLFKHEGGYHQFKMIVPGITYQLFLGKVMPTALPEMCTARSPKGLIYMSPKTDDVNLQGTLDMLKNSRRVGKLATSDRAIISDGQITR